MFQRFLVDAIGPAMVVLLLWLLLSALEGMRGTQPTTTVASIPPREMVLAAGFVCIPLVGLIGCEVSHGPFFDRYFLSSIAGYAIFLGFASSRRQAGSWSAKALAGCMFLLMILDLGATLYLSIRHRIVLTEPSCGLKLSTTPSDPMMLYETVSADKNGLDILVLPNLEYLYLFKNAPPSVAAHLYFGAPEGDLFIAAYERLATWAHIDLRTTTFGPFLATHKRFLVYESGDGPYIDASQAIASGGYRLISAQADAVGAMYEYAK
jgi:hypothetical protein